MTYVGVGQVHLLSVLYSNQHQGAAAGFVYLGHSLRISGSSNAEAIGVSRFRGSWFGGWSQSARTRESCSLHYIDPSVAPTRLLLTLCLGGS